MKQPGRRRIRARLVDTMTRPLRAVPLLLSVIDRLEQDPEGRWLVALRAQLAELANSERAEAREAGRLWLAALGALARVLLEPGPDSEAMARTCTELFARGTEAWLSFVSHAAGDAASTERGAVELEALRAIGSTADAARQVLGGNEEAIAEVWRRAEEARSWLNAVKSEAGP